jgi:hypothetical protein
MVPPRAGLANMLIPWARAEVFGMRHGLRMLAPRWFMPRIGPILRRERDPRFYTGQFSSRGYVRGLRKWAVLARARRVSEDEGDALAKAGFSGSPVVVQFTSYERWFQGLLEHRIFVKRRLHEILSGRVKALVRQPIGGAVVAVHLRRGDMRVMRPGEPYDERNWGTMSDEWFLGAIRSVRGALGEDAPVAIFSDGTDAQLAPFLDLPNTRRAPAASAVVDLIRLSRARVLITTGTSSFSAWAAYLGGMPSVWYPGLRGRFLPPAEGLGEMIETDFQGALAPTSSLADACSGAR